MRALRGDIYITPTDFEGLLYSSVSTGRKAASVFPEAVPEESRRLSSVSKMMSQAATCIPLSSSHLLWYMKSCIKGASFENVSICYTSNSIKSLCMSSSDRPPFAISKLLLPNIPLTVSSGF